MPGRPRAHAPADTPDAATARPRQLAFPFPAATSRRAVRQAVAPRLVVPQIERPLEEIQLERSLAALLPAGRTLAVKLTDNRYTMVMVRRGAGAYTVRLHRMFAAADGKLLRTLARYVVHNDQRASAAIGAFIEENQHVIRRQPRRARRVVLRTAGRAHDLEVIFDRLNRDYFGGGLEARITWGTAPKRQRPRRSIKMGSFAVEDRIIRIHPVLDHPSVPEYFVAWIVFHEMLHGKYEVVRKGDRRCFHSKAFVAEERTFAEYEKACAWERANMDRLLGG
jgi:predicted metal-dependent hydrolase